jgi:hypothetical protein
MRSAVSRWTIRHLFVALLIVGQLCGRRLCTLSSKLEQHSVLTGNAVSLLHRYCRERFVQLLATPFVLGGQWSVLLNAEKSGNLRTGRGRSYCVWPRGCSPMQRVRPLMRRAWGMWLCCRATASIVERLSPGRTTSFIAMCAKPLTFYGSPIAYPGCCSERAG